MEGDADSKVFSTNERVANTIISELPVIKGESVSERLNPELDKNILAPGYLICHDENRKTEIGKVEEKVSRIQSFVKDDSELSPLSNTDSQCSKRESALEPLNRDGITSFTKPTQSGSELPQTEATQLAKHKKAISPSGSKEDDSTLLAESANSDAELQQNEVAEFLSFEKLSSVGGAAFDRSGSRQELSNEEVQLDSFGCSVQSHDKISLPLLKANLKSDDTDEDSNTGSFNDNQQFKGHSEDLETVSDDELSDTIHADTLSTNTHNLSKTGEVVSILENDTLHILTDTLLPETPIVESTKTPIISEISIGSSSSSDVANTIYDKLPSPATQKPLKTVTLQLSQGEAEPVSDGKTQQESSLCGVKDTVTDEVHRPVSVSSSSSVQKKTVEADISGEESSNIDQELPSGCENEGLNYNNNFLESIDSDEEDDLGADLSCEQESSNISTSLSGLRGKTDGKYADTASDEDGEVHIREKLSEEFHAGPRALNRDTEAEKKIVTSNFIDHHEELDYEENEDDGNGKAAESTVVPEKEDEEDGQLTEGENSDKDEGELSDDDVEEGEIKEPGMKKSFVKPMCRFFQRGSCTWGVNCRFLHPGVNDKGNYQMIEIPGFTPVGIRARLGTPNVWPEQPEEQVELPPPPVSDVPPVETAWERGLRLAKEQRKKATERKERESDFEDKRLNLSVEEEWELNKENERLTKVVIPKEPYYDQPVYEEDEYYKIPREPWQTGRSANFQVRYNPRDAYSPPYREKPPAMPSAPYTHPYNPVDDKFERDRLAQRDPYRPEIPPVPIDYIPPLKRPDEWTDPWRRSKSPQHVKPKIRSQSRGRRKHRSDYSHSSRSSSGTSSGSSRSSRSGKSSSGSSSRSRSPKPAPTGADKNDRYMSPSREQPRSTISLRGPGGYDQGYYRGNQANDRNYATGYQRGGYRAGGGGGGRNYHNSYEGVSAGPGISYAGRNMSGWSRGRNGQNRGRSPPDRPLPYARPRPKSASSYSDSSRSRSRSRGRKRSSHSRSSAGSSRSSSSSSSSAGSADSQHLYRDLASPSRNPRGAAVGKKNLANSHKEHSTRKGPPQGPAQTTRPQKQQDPSLLQPSFSLDQIPHPSDPEPPPPATSSGKLESKYASRNAPQAPIKAKDPLKVVGQKSNIRLTLLPKQQQMSSLGSRPNPLDSPPRKRQLSDHDMSLVSLPPAKKIALPVAQASTERLPTERAAKVQIRDDKVKVPPSPIPQPVSSSSSSSSSLSSAPRAKPAVSPQKPKSGIVKSQAIQPAVAKTVPKAPLASAPTGAKAKKNTFSRREELLKQLKAVEDAIAKKKSKMQ